MQEGEYFVNKYKLSLEEKKEGIDNSDLRSFFRPEPNSNVLGSRWKVRNHYKAKVKPTKFNKWLDKNFGEYPVYYDEASADRIKIKLRRYLDNVGYFNSKVSFELEYKKKSLDIIYHIETPAPYRISELKYEVADSVLRTFFDKSLGNSLIKEGDIYNAFTFDDERDRITDFLRNNGYFYFNRNYIQFIVDSAFNDHKMQVTLKINNVQNNEKDSIGAFKERTHRRYYLKNIYVIPDWKPDLGQEYDTIRHEINFWNYETNYVYQFLLDEKKRIKPSAFNSALKIRPENPYSAKELQRTYRGLFNFGIIRTATISFDTTGAGSAEDDSYDYMNSTIRMQTGKLNSFQAELEGTNSSGDLGIRSNIIWSNRNIFKKADIFSLRLLGGLEAQSVVGDADNRLFNTFELGINGNFYFPRFIFPGRLIKFNQRYSPVTNVNLGYTYQDSPAQGRRYIYNIDLSYSWDQNKQIGHILTPINLNYVLVDPSESLAAWIKRQQNPRVVEQYSNHFIAGLKYSFIYNNQNIKVLEHFNYLRMNIETSGNLLYLVDNIFPSSPSRDSTGVYYTIGGVRYAQYFKWNVDFRHYDYFRNKSESLAFRLLLGIAIPYGNSNTVPYEKGFFAGGANDMRGWQFRRLGPGGAYVQNDLERVGDIQIQGNVEYRFTIYKFLKSAFFIDVGNIWLLPQDTIQTDYDERYYREGEFNWSTWYQQLALNAGIGFRLDFNFFIFRVDLAVPILDPVYWGTLPPEPEGGYLNNNTSTLRLPIEWNRTVFNFGIGYPF